MINIDIFIKGKFIRIFQIICNLINSLKANKFERDLIRISYNYKFHNQSKYSLWNTLNTFNKVYKKNIEGSIVECGVWQGINLVFYNYLNLLKNIV